MDKEYTPAEAKAWLSGYDAGKKFAKKEWVGLTEKETIDLALNAFALPEVPLETRLRLQSELVKAMNESDSRMMIFAATIEQALQEKNSTSERSIQISDSQAAESSQP